MKGFQVLINKQSMCFERQGILLFTASLQGNLAYLDGTTLCSPSQSALVSSSPSLLPLTLDLWHCHLSHISFDAVKRLASSDLVTGLCVKSTASPDLVCEPCIAGKQHRIINKTATHSTVPLAIVHCDLHGPMPVAALDGSRYWILMVDDATWLWGLYFLKKKAQAAQAFLDFKVEIEKQTGFVIKCLHDDKEGGLFSNAFNAKLCE